MRQVVQKFTPRKAVVSRIHFAFAAAVAAMFALAWWWTLFISEAIDLRHRLEENALHFQTAVVAMQLATGDAPPALGPAKPNPSVEIVSWNALDEHARQHVARLEPNWPDFAARPHPNAIAALEDDLQKRRLMVYGEGGTLLALIAISLVLFYTLARKERRLRDENDAFLSIITHELKTPVAGVKALLQSLQLGRVPQDRMGPVVAMGLDELDRLDHLIDNVLARNRLRRTNSALAVHSIDLRRYIAALLDQRTVGVTAEREVLVAGEPVVAQADPDAVRIILDNLLDNARKYGVRTGTNASADHPVTRVTLEQQNGFARIHVEDDGIGFAPEESERLFDPFYRGQSAREAGAHAGVQSGAGIGLAIARSLARRMGGDLAAKSDGVGKGSRFTLTLKAG